MSPKRRRPDTAVNSVPPPARSAVGPHEWRSEALLGSRPEVVILHGEERYRLRLTRLNKLILTK